MTISVPCPKCGTTMSGLEWQKNFILLQCPNPHCGEAGFLSPFGEYISLSDRAGLQLRADAQLEIIHTPEGPRIRIRPPQD